jgi:hypothetical protein
LKSWSPSTAIATIVRVRHRGVEQHARGERDIDALLPGLERVRRIAVGAAQPLAAKLDRERLDLVVVLLAQHGEEVEPPFHRLEVAGSAFAA